MALSFKAIQRKSRKRRIRARISGTAERPRLVVHRSLKFTSAQLVDDQAHTVLLSVNDRMLKVKGTKRVRAREVGKEIAKKAPEKGIKQCVFDRAGYQYHGRVREVAEGAREGGLSF